MRCLNLKLTYACTNCCSFCFSSYLKDEVIGEAGLLREVEEGYRRGCRELVLSGGEPTLCPDKLLNVMKRADGVLPACIPGIGTQGFAFGSADRGRVTPVGRMRVEVFAPPAVLMNDDMS